MRGLWSCRRFTLLVQPLFEVEEFLKFLPPRLKDLTLGGVGCLGGVLGGYLGLGEDIV